MNIQKDECFENIDFNGIREVEDIRSKSFEKCTFTDCDFTNSDFSNSLFVDCRFANSNFRATKLSDTKLHNVDFDDCKILGLDFTQISTFIVKIGFRNSQILKCNFSLLELKESDFSDSCINQCDFFRTNAAKSNFSGSDLKGSIFENTDLTKADFTNAQNYSINPLINTIKHAIFTMPEAMTLLDSLEITIQ